VHDYDSICKNVSTSKGRRPESPWVFLTLKNKERASGERHRGIVTAGKEKETSSNTNYT
jgi:hypothetical protein